MEEKTNWSFIKLDAQKDVHIALTSGIFLGNNSAYYKDLSASGFLNIQSSFLCEQFFSYRPIVINNTLTYSFIYGFKAHATTNRSTNAFSYIVCSSNTFNANPALFIDNLFCLSLFEGFKTLNNVDTLNESINTKFGDEPTNGSIGGKIGNKSTKYQINEELLPIVIDIVDKMVKHDFKKTILLKNFDTATIGLIIQGVFYLLPKDIAKELSYVTSASGQEVLKFAVAGQTNQSNLDSSRFIEFPSKNINIETSYGKFLLDNKSRIDDIATKIQQKLESPIFNDLIANKKYSDAAMLTPIFIGEKDNYFNLKFDLQQVILTSCANNLTAGIAKEAVEKLLSASIDDKNSQQQKAAQQSIINLSKQCDFISLINNDDLKKFAEKIIGGKATINFEKINNHLLEYYRVMFDCVLTLGDDEQKAKFVNKLSNNYIEAAFVRQYLTDLLECDDSRQLIKYLLLENDFIETYFKDRSSNLTNNQSNFSKAVEVNVVNPNNIESNLKILLSIENNASVKKLSERKNSLNFLAAHCFNYSIEEILGNKELIIHSNYLYRQAYAAMAKIIGSDDKETEKTIKKNLDEILKFCNHINELEVGDNGLDTFSIDKIKKMSEFAEKEKKSFLILTDENDGFLTRFNQFDNYVKNIPTTKAETNFFKTTSATSYSLIICFVLIDLLLSIPIFYMDKVIFLYSLLSIPLTIIVSLVIQFLFEKTLKKIMMKYISLGALFSSIIPLVLINICLFALMFI